MEDAAPPREYIEAKLNFLLFVDAFQIKVLLSYDEISYPPIEPGEAHFDVKVGVLIIPILRVINFVDLL